MSRRLFDLTEELINSTDLEVHKKRAFEPKDLTFRKKTAESLLHQKRYDIFKIADVAKLPVMIVREIEADYNKRKGGVM